MSAPYRVYVIELDDGAGPRRRADRPNLHVGITSMDPADKFKQIKQSSNRNHLRGHLIRLRTDLARSYQPTTEVDARRQRRKLSAKLLRQGYTVNGDRRVWQLYVIELAGPRSTANTDRARLFVGETSKSPAERLQEHLTGARNGRGRLYSAVVRREGGLLRPDLVLIDEYGHQLRHTTRSATSAPTGAAGGTLLSCVATERAPARDAKTAKKQGRPTAKALADRYGDTLGGEQPTEDPRVRSFEVLPSKRSHQGRWAC